MDHPSRFKVLFSFLFLFVYLYKTNAQDLRTPFERNNNQTATYEECIEFYKKLAKSFSAVKIIEAGPSDVGRPLMTVVLSSRKTFTPQKTRKAGKAVLMINNGIHPGESDGIDAAMLFARSLVNDPHRIKLLDEVTIVIIPVYNVGGSLMRNKNSRVNQNGPMEYGFRGNAQNLDLNRDFIKCDSRNAETFNKLFHYWDPDVFLETHTTDGADYSYAMTLISTQRHKLQENLAGFMYKKFQPAFLNALADNGIPSSPYVNAFGDPAHGIYGFLDLPRYSTGYASLFHCIGFMSESHMLKPYPARVAAQQKTMESLLVTIATMKTELMESRVEAKRASLSKVNFDIHWTRDESRADSIFFSGYTVEKSISPVTGMEKIHYNTGKPYVKKIPYYNVFKPSVTIKIPEAYLVPAAYDEIIQRMKWNSVQMRRLPQDTVVKAKFYKIINYTTSPGPYEKHYPHSEIKVQEFMTERKYFKGDYMIITQQESVRYIVETLEPEGPDSFFAWNFFDGILQRKEYFSDYLFEDLAIQILESDQKLKDEFEHKKKTDPIFSKDSGTMLEFIYDRSVYADPAYRVYPVARLMKAEN